MLTFASIVENRFSFVPTEVLFVGLPANWHLTSSCN